MNHDNIRILRDHLAAGTQPFPFDMSKTLVAFPDGTPVSACLVGQAALLSDPNIIADYDMADRPADEPVMIWGAVNEATTWLGLDEDQAHDLFCPLGYSDPEAHTAADAVRALDHLLETGEVQWT